MASNSEDDFSAVDSSSSSDLSELSNNALEEDLKITMSDVKIKCSSDLRLPALQ